MKSVHFLTSDNGICQIIRVCDINTGIIDAKMVLDRSRDRIVAGGSESTETILLRQRNVGFDVTCVVHDMLLNANYQEKSTKCTNLPDQSSQLSNSRRKARWRCLSDALMTLGK